MTSLSRRHFLLGTGAAVLLAACSDEGGSPTVEDADGTTTTDGSGGPDGSTGDPTTTTTTPITTDGDIVLGEAFDRNGMLVAGIVQRAPFVLFERSGGLVPFADAPETIDFTAVPEGGDPLPTITVARRGDDVERAYYPLAVTFPDPGTWSVRADLGGGTVLESLVNVNPSVTIPQVAEPMPSVVTPTTANPAGAATVCTRDTPCPFHEVSLDAALAEGRPVAVLLSTPAYCQVGICGPVLDLLIAQAPDHPDLAVIHVEVYADGPPPDVLPTSIVSDTFGLPYEPALFVAGADGAITARLDNIYDGTELAEALSTA